MADYTIIGKPYAGTHTLGDWQSDDAYDLGTPVGTKMLAAFAGVISKVTRHPQGAGRFAGDQITLTADDGSNALFYAHGVATVKPGQHVNAGDELGTTGSANGVAHLHLGAEHDPAKFLGSVLGGKDSGTSIGGKIAGAVGGAATGAAGDVAGAVVDGLLGKLTAWLGKDGARIALTVGLVLAALALIALGLGRTVGLGEKLKSAGRLAVSAGEAAATDGASLAAKT